MSDSVKVTFDLVELAFLWNFGLRFILILMRKLITILLFLTASLAYSQVLKISVVSGEDMKGISGAHIFLDKVEQISDKDGLSIYPQAKIGDSLIIRHVGYESDTLILSKKLFRKAVQDTIYLQIRLFGRDMGTFTVTAGKPETVFGSDSLSIADYAFFGQNFIMLAYEKRLKKGSRLMLVNPFQEILCEAEINDEARHLHTDYEGNVYVLCVDSVYKAIVNGHRLSFENLVPTEFYQRIYNIADTCQNHVFYSNFTDIYPAFSYYAYNWLDSSDYKLCTIEDEFTMELYRAEYKYANGQEKLWARRMEEKTGIDKQIWTGAKFFTNSLYYHPVYAPLYVWDDEVYVFDHYKNFLFQYEPGNMWPIDSTAIAYHYLKGQQDWVQKLFQDNLYDDVYTGFQSGRNIHISKINFETGDLEKTTKLYHPYPERIKIKGGYAYYIYRPFESTQKKYIYRERLGD